jgi:hypothetical protein
LLRRNEVDCIVLERGESEDHCLVQISSVRRPGRRGLVEYVNQGSESRVATIKVEPSESELPSLSPSGQFFWIRRKV